MKTARPIYRDKSAAAAEITGLLRQSLLQAVIPYYVYGEQDHDRRTL